ncbi:DUF748 domain-containing protein [Uliginosibacterium aquaticum]|uniref:DUF748 domain-containing protein n=1 Tax=Uliginosibacterium aquaticum TaxID=2731212 RepID=A0ABX2IKA8_9RHOO|nr:DUF748 domain-containing protein [Uliginosibacterium aquaticum]NSL55452.1 DUF748 domain-containing protein [Uliginosibacterium aquaticum]
MKSRKLRLSLLIGLPLLAVLLVAGYFAALHILKQQIVAALGTTGEVREIRISLAHIEIEGLRIKASRPGWPAADELRAERVSVTPALRSLLSSTIVVRSIAIEDAALSVLRSRAGLKILPALLEAPAKPAAKPEAAPAASTSGPKIRIERITLANSRVDFFDATVAAKPLHIPLDQIELSLEDLLLPAMDERARLHLQARVAGQGSLALEGDLVPANMDSDLRLKLANVPLKLVEPYLFKGKAGEIKRGSLALDLHSKVAQRQLKAPGHMVLSQLEIGGLAGLTREAAAAFARAKGLDADTRRPVDMDFTLQGNLDDARFSLNEAIYAQGGLAALKLIGLGSNSGSSSSGGGLGETLKGWFGK